MASSTMLATTAGAPPRPHSSASGLLSMLSEEDPTLRRAALERLLLVVDVLWHEVAEFLPELEAMAEDDALDPQSRMTAAAVASRVFFHLEEPNQALRLALEGGEKNFDVVHDRSSAYVECLVDAAIDAYVKSGNEDSGTTNTGDEDMEEDLQGMDQAKLQRVVESMFERCYADHAYTHALGVALEAKKVDKVREVLERCPPPAAGPCPTLLYALDAAVHLVTSQAFRDDVLRVVAERLQQSGGDNLTTAPTLTICHQLLRMPQEVAATLLALVSHDDDDATTENDDVLLAYQLCFDVVDSGDQSFVADVAHHLSSSTTTTASSAAEEQDTKSDAAQERLAKLQQVLVGGFPAELALSFLHKHSDSDRRIMDNMKRSLEERGGSRNSVLHNCAVVTHSYLNAGTTNDSFLRDNLDWMRKASNWAKFSATASLGVLHARHTTEAMSLLEPYLPPVTTDASAVSPTGGYSEGGSLYALGLIHAGTSASSSNETREFLRNHLRNSHANEVISHGAALGVGLTAFGSGDVEIVQELKELLETDSAVAGEAAGIAIGLVCVGKASPELSTTIAELKDYARDTKHEKIIRGIAMGLALLHYGQEENADAVIEEMRGDRDPILRYGAQYAIAMAYCGTGSNRAIRILLHTAVSDVSDDVRMASVISLAFVLYKTPERVPQLVKLLLESFNPHVRYASCIAVGIAMAGSGDGESVALLEPMLEDMTDFVRQGAFLGTAMIYMQQSDTCNGKKVKSFREKLASTISDKHQSTLTKMGATMATGLIDAGGRNCCLDMGSRNGFTKVTTAVGLVLWLQHWHWFPMMHMLSVALTPTFTIGLNKDFKYPKHFEIECKSKPSVFAYPKRLEEKKEKEKKRVETVTLSTTAKNKARLARKRAHKDGEDGVSNADDATTAMEIDNSSSKEEDDEEKKPKVDETDDATAMDIDKDEKTEDKKATKTKKQPEANTFRIANPARVTKKQSGQCEFDLKQRYRPVRQHAVGGVIVLTDSTPGEEEEVSAVKAPSLDSEDEADAPEPFEWAPPGHAEHVAAPVVSEEVADATA